MGSPQEQPENHNRALAVLNIYRDIVPTLVLAGILWLLNGVSVNSSDIRVMTNEISNLSKRVDDYKLLSADRFTGADAKDAFLLRDKRFEKLNGRVLNLERKAN